LILENLQNGERPEYKNIFFSFLIPVREKTGRIEMVKLQNTKQCIHK